MERAAHLRLVVDEGPRVLRNGGATLSPPVEVAEVLPEPVSRNPIDFVRDACERGSFFLMYCVEKLC